MAFENHLLLETGGFRLLETGAGNRLLENSPAGTVVPNVVGDPIPAASAALTAVGLFVGTITGAVDTSVPIGTVISQNPVGGSVVAPGSSVDLVISVPATNFDVMLTVISQYQNSPVLLQLIENMGVYLNQQVNYAMFYAYVWNVSTAVDFGLDIWGKIVNIGRALNVNGSPVILGNDDFRTLILVKALSNIVATTAPAMNQLLTNLFGTLGRTYVTDSGGMEMHLVFEYVITDIQRAILTQSGALPHPAGVRVNIVSFDPAHTFGFHGSGLQPFNQGTFWA